MLKENTSDSFPGAGMVAADPVSAGECCSLQSMAAIEAAADAAGFAYTYRAGRLWVAATAAEMLVLCQGVIPVPTSFSADPMDEGTDVDLLGSLFGAVEGVLYLTEAATWAGSSTRVVQVITTWTAGAIDFVMTADGLPVAPAKVYAYVETACGAKNAVGLEGSYQV